MSEKESEHYDSNVLSIASSEEINFYN